MQTPSVTGTSTGIGYATAPHVAQKVHGVVTGMQSPARADLPRQTIADLG